MEIGIGDIGVAAIGIDSGFAICGLCFERVADLISVAISSCGQVASEARVFIQNLAGIGGNRQIFDGVDGQADGIGIDATFVIVDRISERVSAVEIGIRYIRITAVSVDSGLAIGSLGSQCVADLVTIGIGCRR